MLKYYVDGGLFMHPILIITILALMMIIVKAVHLFMASQNTKRFMLRIQEALKEGGVDKASEICASTRGPVASIMHAGLIRFDRGIDTVEKAIVNAASVELALLERGLVWLSTAIALAPMFGFTGTVAGMMSAFEEIAKANDISPSIVAAGIGQALLTTIFGLISAMISQFFFSIFTAKIQALVVDMEEASVQLVESLIVQGRK
ncbi:MAG: MotA/TolQ/ExbB proton channel family protein [bacterium]|jgi:biopolymer transport protein ExbB|nr:MotA/TolQ/ExbB proton channel family protein [bacterium]